MLAIIFLGIFNLPKLLAADVPPSTYAPSPWNLIPRGHGAWVYHDVVSDIAHYNRGKSSNRIRLIYLLGGEVTVMCESGGDCGLQDVDALFYQDTKIQRAFDQLGDDILVLSTLDGGVGSSVLKNGFNDLNDDVALWLALKVGAKYCATDSPGVQVDIEPYLGHLDKGQGQLRFYHHLAQVLAGQHDQYKTRDLSGPITCITDAFPKGRFFSVFMSARRVDRKLTRILEEHHNGYVEVSGYDITKRSVSKMNEGVTATFADPTDYGQALSKSLKAIQEAGVPYRVGLPFSATSEEFESVVTDEGTVSGFPQHQYIDAALEAISRMEICKDDLFLGISVWGYSQPYGFHDYKAVMPNQPQSDTLERLAAFECEISELSIPRRQPALTVA